MNPLTILRLIFWRPLPVFFAGAFLSIALIFKGPSNVGLYLIAPGMWAVQGINAMLRAQICEQTQ